MRLYEINSEIQQILDTYIEVDEQLVEAETGAILEDEMAAAVMDTLDKLNCQREEKIESIACWIKGMDAEEEALKAESKKLKERADRLAKKRDRVTGFLEQTLAGEKFKTEKVVVSYRKSAQTVIRDEDELPEEYWKVKITRDPDKTAIKKAIKDGIEVPGAEVIEVMNMSIK